MLITGWHLERTARPFLGSKGPLLYLALFFSPVTFGLYFWSALFLWIALLSQMWNNRFIGTGVALYLCALASFCLNLRDEISHDTF